MWQIGQSRACLHIMLYMNKYPGDMAQKTLSRSLHTTRADGLSKNFPENFMCAGLGKISDTSRAQGLTPQPLTQELHRCSFILNKWNLPLFLR